MVGEAELGGDRRGPLLADRLHDAAGDDGIGAARNDVVQEGTVARPRRGQVASRSDSGLLMLCTGVCV